MTKEEIQRVLDLSLEYYKSEIFGTDKESEKPSCERIDWIYDKMNGGSEVPKDLEEAAVNIADELLVKQKDYALSAKADYWNGAYDGIIAGAKWQEKQNLRFVKQVLSGDFTVFEAGRKYERKQMMKKAVEGTVYGNGDYTWVAGDIPSQFKYGDKVRVIVLPKED